MDGIIKKPQPRQNKIIFVIIYLNWTVSLVKKMQHMIKYNTYNTDRPR